MQSLWILVAALLFSLMSVLVKLASAAHSTWEILLWRNAVGMIFLIPLIRSMSGGLRANLVTPYWSAHMVRNLSGVIAVLLWFAAIAHLPLATATTLNYTSSLFVGLILFISASWGGRIARQGPMFFALVLGFVGVVFVLRPTIDKDQIVWALLGLISGALAGVAMLSVRALGKLGEPSSRTVFYFSLSGFMVGLIGVLGFGFNMPNWLSAGYLLGTGLSAVLAQLAMTRAYGQGETLLAANLNYSGILFASALGWWIWGDVVPWVAWIGITFIIGAGALATWLTHNEDR